MYQYHDRAPAYMRLDRTSGKKPAPSTKGSKKNCTASVYVNNDVEGQARNVCVCERELWTLLFQLEPKEFMRRTQNDKDGKEGIAVNVKGVQPLHLLFDVGTTGGRRQVSIGNFSTNGGQDTTQPEPVPDDGIEDKAEGAGEGNAKGDRVGHGGNAQKESLEGDKGRVVAGPVIFGLFAVIGSFVDDLGACTEEGFHLIQGGLDVHLPHIG